MREVLDTIEADIKERLAALLKRIEEAKANGENVNRTWLLTEERYHDLLAQCADYRSNMAAGMAPVIAAAQKASVEEAAKQAEQLTLFAVGPLFDKAEVSFHWNRLPVQTLEAFVGHAGDGSPLRDLLDELGPQVAQGIENALLAGIANGDGAEKIGRSIDAVMGKGRARAMNWARTEVHRAAREATRASYQANSGVVSGWIWLSAADSRTCVCCWAMHGTEHSNDERLDGHPQCRCVMVPRTKSWAELVGDPTIPDTRPEIPTGEALFNALPTAKQKAILGPELYELWASGKITLADCVQRKNSDRWGSMRTAATIDQAKTNAAQSPVKATP